MNDVISEQERETVIGISDAVEAGGYTPTLEDVQLLLKLFDRTYGIAQIAVDLYDPLWSLVYPDNPNGWEYPGQIYVHLNQYILELKAQRGQPPAEGA